MKKLDLETVENLAAKMRSEYLRISSNEPVNTKTALRQLNIMTVYSPLSDNIFGLSLMTQDRKNRFMLVNSNMTRGAQHFTVAHELYHLYFDENSHPHLCNQPFADPAERSANMFASALLMPKDGIVMSIPTEELKKKEIGIDTDNEDCFDAWLHPNNESYEIYAGDTFSETAKIYESERA